MLLLNTKMEMIDSFCNVVYLCNHHPFNPYDHKAPADNKAFISAIGSVHFYKPLPNLVIS